MKYDKHKDYKPGRSLKPQHTYCCRLSSLSLIVHTFSFWKRRMSLWPMLATSVRTLAHCIGRILGTKFICFLWIDLLLTWPGRSSMGLGHVFLTGAWQSIQLAVVVLPVGISHTCYFTVPWLGTSWPRFSLTSFSSSQRSPALRFHTSIRWLWKKQDDHHIC